MVDDDEDNEDDDVVNDDVVDDDNDEFESNGGVLELVEFVDVFFTLSLSDINIL